METRRLGAEIEERIIQISHAVTNSNYEIISRESKDWGVVQTIGAWERTQAASNRGIKKTKSIRGRISFEKTANAWRDKTKGRKFKSVGDRAKMDTG